MARPLRPTWMWWGSHPAWTTLRVVARVAPRHGRRVHGHTFRRVIAGDRADRAINHPIDPHFAVVVHIALEKDPIAGHRLALDRLRHGETESVPGKGKPYGAAFLDVSQRPAGIIKVCEPGWAAPPLSHQALIGSPGTKPGAIRHPSACSTCRSSLFSRSSATLAIASSPCVV